MFSRYGPEIYQHANNWRHLSQSSGNFYKTGSFIKCQKPGHHACLDQFKGDGGIPFHSDLADP